MERRAGILRLAALAQDAFGRLSISACGSDAAQTPQFRLRAPPSTTLRVTPAKRLKLRLTGASVKVGTSSARLKPCPTTSPSASRNQVGWRRVPTRRAGQFSVLARRKGRFLVAPPPQNANTGRSEDPGCAPRNDKWEGKPVQSRLIGAYVEMDTFSARLKPCPTRSHEQRGSRLHPACLHLSFGKRAPVSMPKAWKRRLKQ